MVELDDYEILTVLPFAHVSGGYWSCTFCRAQHHVTQSWAVHVRTRSGRELVVEACASCAEEALGRATDPDAGDRAAARMLGTAARDLDALFEKLQLEVEHGRWPRRILLSPVVARLLEEDPHRVIDEPGTWGHYTPPTGPGQPAYLFGVPVEVVEDLGEPWRLIRDTP